MNFLQRLLYKNMGRDDLLEDSTSLTTSDHFRQVETLEDRIEELEGQLASLNEGFNQLEDAFKSLLNGYLVVKLEAIVEGESGDDDLDEDSIEL